MERYIIAVFICCCAFLGSCSKEGQIVNVRPTATGEYKDERDGNTYKWVRIGDLEWMTSNLKYCFVTPYYECTYYIFGENWPVQVLSHNLDTDFEADYEEYGNFYSWEEACIAAPEGWRLPTDADWKNLEMALGMSTGMADSEGWRGDQEATLLRQGENGTGLAFQLSGEVADTDPWNTSLILSFVGEYGYFWSASEVENSGLQVPTVWFRKICAHYTTIYRGSATTERLMRVRCCRDAGI